MTCSFQKNKSIPLTISISSRVIKLNVSITWICAVYAVQLDGLFHWKNTFNQELKKSISFSFCQKGTETQVIYARIPHQRSDRSDEKVVFPKQSNVYLKGGPIIKVSFPCHCHNNFPLRLNSRQQQQVQSYQHSSGLLTFCQVASDYLLWRNLGLPFPPHRQRKP